jgi:hypothetical protein
MPIWLPPTAAEQPDVALSHWSAFEVFVPELGEPTIHIVGINARSGEGRVSSPVTGVNEESRSVTTSTGRTYRLLGAPCITERGRYVWSHWVETWNADVRGNASSALFQRFEPPAEASA